VVVLRARAARADKCGGRLTVAHAPRHERGMEGHAAVAGGQSACLQQGQGASEGGRREMAARAKLLDGATAFQQCAEDYPFRLRQRRDQVPAVRVLTDEAKPMQQGWRRGDEFSVVVRNEPIATA